jgi:UDP-GlcNAc:undecaprenyl-phosphate GlcNAc-1-phosphate transferase
MYILAFTSSLLLSVIFTGLARKVGLKFKFYQKPRKRDIHKKLIPRIGGIAIFSAFLIVSALLIYIFRDDYFTGRLWKKAIGLLIGGGIISLSMLWDDIKGLKPWQKFAFQFLAAFAVIASSSGIDYLSNPFGKTFDLNLIYIPIATIHGVTYHFSLISDLLTLIWLVGMMNVINFVDGIDGLAAGFSTIAALTIFLLASSLVVSQPGVALIAITLAGAAAGFLIWNFPPAKVFMGDSGSMLLGFTLGALTLISGGKLATAFLVLGFPIVDGLIVAIGRVVRGKNPFTTPDKTHLHHRFLEAGFSPKFALIFMYAIAIAFAWVALRATTSGKLLAAALLVVLLLIIIFVLNRIKNYESKIKKD